MRHSILLAIFLSGLVSLRAQDFSGMATTMPRMKAVFTKLFAETPAFSVKANIEMFDLGGKLQMMLSMRVALDGAAMRQEMDLGGMSLPPETRAGLKALQLDPIVIVTRADRKRVYLVFPGVEAYQEFSITDSVLNEINVRTEQAKMQRTKLAQETVNGFVCTKTKVLLIETNKPTEEALLWCADELQQFPVRMEITEKNRMSKYSFHDIKIGKPDASLFEVPKHFVMFADTKAVMRFAKEKQKSGAEAAPK